MHTCFIFFFFCPHSNLKQILASFCFTLNTFVCISKKYIFLHNHNTITTPNKINNSLISSNSQSESPRLAYWNQDPKKTYILHLLILSLESFFSGTVFLPPPPIFLCHWLAKETRSVILHSGFAFASSWYCLTYSSISCISYNLEFKFKEQNRFRFNFFGAWQEYVTDASAWRNRTSDSAFRSAKTDHCILGVTAWSFN